MSENWTHKMDDIQRLEETLRRAGEAVRSMRDEFPAGPYDRMRLGRLAYLAQAVGDDIMRLAADGSVARGRPYSLGDIPLDVLGERILPPELYGPSPADAAYSDCTLRVLGDRVLGSYSDVGSHEFPSDEDGTTQLMLFNGLLLHGSFRLDDLCHLPTPELIKPAHTLAAGVSRLLVEKACTVTKRSRWAHRLELSHHVTVTDERQQAVPRVSGTPEAPASVRLTVGVRGPGGVMYAAGEAARIVAQRLGRDVSAGQVEALLKAADFSKLGLLKPVMQSRSVGGRSVALPHYSHGTLEWLIRQLAAE